VYAWLRDYITLEETVIILERKKDTVDGLSQLLEEIEKRIRFS
jgi:hypothetical protein